MSNWPIPERPRRLIRAELVTPTDATAALDGMRDILVLSGNPGCGKTVAAAAWAKGKPPEPKYGALIIEESSAFLSASRLARIQRYDNMTMRELLSVTRLVIDDLGTEYMDEKGNFMSILDEVIDDRYANRRKTVITTNMMLDAFRARYGERIADRIRECGAFISLASSSMRRPISDEQIDASIIAARERREAEEIARKEKLRAERDAYFSERADRRARETEEYLAREATRKLAEETSDRIESEEEIRERENAARNKIAADAAAWRERNPS